MTFGPLLSTLAIFVIWRFRSSTDMFMSDYSVSPRDQCFLVTGFFCSLAGVVAGVIVQSSVHRQIKEVDIEPDNVSEHIGNATLVAAVVAFLAFMTCLSTRLIDLQ